MIRKTRILNFFLYFMRIIISQKTDNEFIDVDKKLNAILILVLKILFFLCIIFSLNQYFFINKNRHTHRKMTLQLNLLNT